MSLYPYIDPTNNEWMIIYDDYGLITFDKKIKIGKLYRIHMKLPSDHNWEIGCEIFLFVYSIEFF